MNLTSRVIELKQLNRELKQSSVFVSLVFSFVFIVGGWLFYKQINQTIIDEGDASKSWPIVQGMLCFADIESSMFDGDEMYRVELLYTYSVQGENYTGNRIYYPSTRGELSSLY